MPCRTAPSLPRCCSKLPTQMRSRLLFRARPAGDVRARRCGWSRSTGSPHLLIWTCMGGGDAQNPVRAQRPVEGRSASQSEPGHERVVQMAAEAVSCVGVSEGGCLVQRARGVRRERQYVRPYSVHSKARYAKQVRTKARYIETVYCIRGPRSRPSSLILSYPAAVGHSLGARGARRRAARGAGRAALQY